MQRRTQILDAIYENGVIRLLEPPPFELAEGQRVRVVIFDEDDVRWSQQFADSQAALARLAEEALAEYQAGKTLPLDPSTL